MSLIFHLFQNNYLPETVALWNASAADCHGFYPLTEDIFRRHVLWSPGFSPERLIVAGYHGALVGLLHYDIVDVFPYPRAGVISAVMVHPDYRQNGFAAAMLQEAVERLERQGVAMIDALGAWPYSSYYVGLIDGSERAGVDLRNSAAQWLFSRAGFRKRRPSLIMRAPIPPASALAEEPELLARPSAELVYCQPRDGKTTWLDRAFRHWQAFDHVLLNEHGRVLSNAIYARMDGYSEYVGKEVYSVYGVNTPEFCRRQGYAAENLRRMQARLASLGGQEMEIHTYADNFPAIRLYESVGFRKIGETVIMRR